MKLPIKILTYAFFLGWMIALRMLLPAGAQSGFQANHCYSHALSFEQNENLVPAQSIQWKTLDLDCTSVLGLLEETQSIQDTLHGLRIGRESPITWGQYILLSQVKGNDVIMNYRKGIWEIYSPPKVNWWGPCELYPCVMPIKVELES